MFTQKLDEKSLIQFAQEFAMKIEFPSVYCFVGDLGAGKTTFCRAIIKTLMEDDNLIVPSPTFTLVQEYETRKGHIFHFDLYRLNSSYELIELNFEEALNTGVCLIEWPDRANISVPFTKIEILKESDTTRTINISTIHSH